MTSYPTKRFLALLVSAALLASLTVATVASPASAAKPKCQGFKATIVGTKKGEVIRGTAKRDIIVAKGGNDRIYGKGGNDIICAGGGNDRVYGGPGADRLWGQLGHDKLNGNAGPDFLAGQVGNDTLVGGIGVDTCFQGTGSGPVARCERPAPPAPPPAQAPAPPAAPPGPSLIDLDAMGILAVAYSDIDGLDGYSTDDVLIAKLVDTSGNGEPGAGDTIQMGRYPIVLDPKGAGDFGDWGVLSHRVVSGSGTSTQVNVLTATGAGSTHMWSRVVGGSDEVESYTEHFSPFGPEARFADQMVGDYLEFLRADTSSPSEPKIGVDLEPPKTYTDDDFIDVMLNY